MRKYYLLVMWIESLLKGSTFGSNETMPLGIWEVILKDVVNLMFLCGNVETTNIGEIKR